MAEEETRQDGTRENRGGSSSREGHRQPLMWHPSAAPYFKWKLFVRGHDSTLQGRGVCERGGEGQSSAPTLDGEATKTFYQSVVAQTDTHTQEEYVSRQEERNRNKPADINTDRHWVRDSGGQRHTHTPHHKLTVRQRDRHRKTDSSRLSPMVTNATTLTGTHNTARNSRQGSSSSCEDGRTDHDPRHPHLPPSHTLPEPQHTHTALRLAQTNDTAALSTMLDQGLNINTKDGYGWSLLMVAACAGALDTVQMLLSRGARTGFRDARGNTALYLATVKGHWEVTEILVKANKRRTRRMADEERNNDEEQRAGESNSSETVDDEEYFCDTCKVMVKEKNRVRHKASIVHQFKLAGGSTRTHYGIPPSNRGFQLLLGQGWDMEGGLGSENQGHKFPVKTVLKRDRKGLGAGGDATPRVTHFGPGDSDAVKRTPNGPGMRLERPTTTTRREMKRKKTKEQMEEIRLRRMLNEPDY